MRQHRHPRLALHALHQRFAAARDDQVEQPGARQHRRDIGAVGVRARPARRPPASRRRAARRRSAALIAAGTVHAVGAAAQDHRVAGLQAQRRRRRRRRSGGFRRSCRSPRSAWRSAGCAGRSAASIRPACVPAGRAAPPRPPARGPSPRRAPRSTSAGRGTRPCRWHAATSSAFAARIGCIASRSAVRHRPQRVVARLPAAARQRMGRRPGRGGRVHQVVGSRGHLIHGINVPRKRSGFQRPVHVFIDRTGPVVLPCSAKRHQPTGWPTKQEDKHERTRSLRPVPHRCL